MEESITIKHAEGNVFVDNFDDQVSLSVWMHTGHARAYLTQKQAQELIDALQIAIKAAEAA